MANSATVTAMSRWLIYCLMAGIGFASGAVVFNRNANSASGPNADGESLAQWSAKQPGPIAKVGEEPPRDEFDRAQRAKRVGLGSAVRANMQLVADTPLSELPDLQRDPVAPMKVVIQ